MKILKEEIIEGCLWLRDKNLVISTWGNISIRLEDTFFITPSGISYDKMKPENIVEVDFEGNKLGGSNLPSSEMDLHRLIYLKRDDIGSIIHFHSTYAMAVCSIGRSIPPLSEEICQAVGGEIPCTLKYVPAGHHYELAEEAVRYIKDGNALLLKNHGPVCFGIGLKEALEASEVVEKAARIFLSVYKNDSDISVIPDKFVKEERARYVNMYRNKNS